MPHLWYHRCPCSRYLVVKDVVLMASIERTAYPRYNRFLTPQEIQTQYTLTDDERCVER